MGMTGEDKRLSATYESTFGEMLAELGAATGVEPPDLTAFWPMVGQRFDRSPMVIGRAVNGWMDHITVDELSDPAARAALLAAVRRTAEGDGGCPLRWVTERPSPAASLALTTAR